MSSRIYLIAVLVFAAIPLWSQGGPSGAQPAGEGAAIWSPMEASGDAAAEDDAPMILPALLNDDGYSLTFASETPRTNYMSGGVNFLTVYDDNILPLSGPTVTDVKYSVEPNIDLQQSRSRLTWNLAYSPGFRFYQRNRSLNGVDHNLGLSLQYRVSPHVTLSFGENFQKATDLLYSSDTSFGSGSTPSLLPPSTPRITTLSTVQATYQFSQNGMVGIEGTFSGLWYPSRSNLDRLFDSTAGGSEVFYMHRVSRSHYLGVTYGFQKLLTHPGKAETQTQSALLFYTFTLPPTLEISVFAGPEHADTHNGDAFPLRNLLPATGFNLAWHGERASVLAGYSKRLSDGGGLATAARSDRAEASVRWQVARSLTASLGGSYWTNHLLDSQSEFGFGGHTWSETASLNRDIGERLEAKVGYTRLYQTYPNIPAIASAPNRNNVWVSISYKFDRPLGR